MTDEKIREEFEKWFITIPTKEAIQFNKSVGYKQDYSGFYAGFRTAERLAKISMLEEVIGMLCTFPYAGNEKVKRVEVMLSGLKEVLI